MKEIIYILFFLFSYGNTFALHISIEPCLKFYKEHQTSFEKMAKKWNLDHQEIVSIALPEEIRFQEWQNYLEATALRQFYIKGGKEDADFSIGHFQMKPSFVEDLECAIVENETFSILFQELIPEGDWSPEEVRKFRIENLDNISTQFKYLCAFYKIMELKTTDYNFKTRKEKIFFFSSAYNLGFNKPKKQIQNWTRIKAFPYGRKFNFEQDSFSEIAWNIYLSINSDL